MEEADLRAAGEHYSGGVKPRLVSEAFAQWRHAAPLLALDADGDGKALALLRKFSVSKSSPCRAVDVRGYMWGVSTPPPNPPLSRLQMTKEV